MPRTFGNLIAGREVGSEPTFESRNSSDHADVVGIFPEATREQVREACIVAREAFPAWSKTPAPIRGELIGRFGEALAREKEPLSRLVTREMGKTLKEARGSVQEAIDTCRFFQSEGRRLYGPPPATSRLRCRRGRSCRPSSPATRSCGSPPRTRLRWPTPSPSCWPKRASPTAS